MRKILTFLMIVAFVVPLWAAPYNMVCVNLSDGSTVKIVMTESLEIQFDKENLVANSDGSEVTVPKTNILNFKHTYDASTAVEEVLNNNGLTFENGMLLFNGLPAEAVISVYDLSGKLLRRVNAEGDFSLSLDSFQKGIYIVNVNHVSYKVNIK